MPAAYQSLLAAGKAAGTAAIAAGLDLLLVELVRIRSSQLNGCAFCLRMHTRDALAHGESTDRLAVLAEELTVISDRRNDRLGKTETELDRAALTEEQRAVVGWLAIMINAFNRVAIVSRSDVAPWPSHR